MIPELAWFGAAFSTATAGLLAFLFPRYRPIAIALLAELAADVARELLFQSAERGALLADRALAMVHPAAGFWLALRILVGCRRPALAAFGAPLLVATLTTLAGCSGPLACSVFHAVCLGGQLWAVTGAVASGRQLWRWRPERACLLLLAGELAARFGPWLGSPGTFWDIGLAQGVLVAAVLCYHQVRWIGSLTSGGGSSASPRPGSSSLA